MEEEYIFEKVGKAAGFWAALRDHEINFELLTKTELEEVLSFTNILLEYGFQYFPETEDVLNEDLEFPEVTKEQFKSKVKEAFIRIRNYYEERFMKEEMKEEAQRKFTNGQRMYLLDRLGILDMLYNGLFKDRPEQDKRQTLADIVKIHYRGVKGYINNEDRYTPTIEEREQIDDLLKKRFPDKF